MRSPIVPVIALFATVSLFGAETPKPAAKALEKARQEEARKACEKAKAEVNEISKKVDQLRKEKKGDEALAAAEEAVKIAAAHPNEWVINQAAYGALGTAYSAKNDWAKCVAAFLKMSENHNPSFGCKFHLLGYDAIITVMRDGRTDEARGYLKRVRALDKLDTRDIPKCIDIEARTYKVDKNWSAFLKLYEDAFADTNLVAKAGAVTLINNAVTTYKEAKPGFTAVFEYYDWVFANPKKYGIGEKEMPGLVRSYAEQTWKSMDFTRMKDAKRRADAIGLTELGGMFPALYKHHVNMAKFPLSEEELNIPENPTAFLGFDPNRKVVHAKDFGWNPTNATECLQKALEADATTVVIDAMPTPWYIWAVTLTKEQSSNRRIVFQKGCTILTAPEHRRKNDPGWYRVSMITLKGCTNVWIEGEGTLGKDVYIGKYRNRRERLAAGFEYGGSGFQGHGCRRVVLKNLWVANCGQDALCWGGHESYVIDCLFDDNYRQGLSLGGSTYCVYKNVTFCNTFGGEPHCGIDFEPYYEIDSVPYQYFIDCKFYNNASKNVIFATSTYAPMTALFKRCQFEAQRNGNICIVARIGIYLNAMRHAPSNIIFDECRIDGYSDGHANPLQFETALFYDVTFRNCVINDKGPFGRDGDHRASPIALQLHRAVWDGFYPYPGIVTFDNVKVNGYENVPLVEVKDSNGKYGVNSFRGTIDHNGKMVDLSTFSYLPPDRTLKECAEADTKTLAAPAGTAVPWKPAFDFVFGHAWYNPLPRYTYLARGEKGKKATFVVDFRHVRKQDGVVRVTKPDGAKVEVATPVKGENTIEYVFPEDGVYAFDFNVTDGTAEENFAEGFSIKSVKGTHLAYQSGLTNLGRPFEIRTGDTYPPYTGYFEMPGGKTCTVKLTGGGAEFRDASGKSALVVKKGDYAGQKCVTLKTASDKNEIWSFTTLDPALKMKFFDPLPGVWADDPAWLPTLGGNDLPFTRVPRARLSAAEMPQARLFALPIRGAIAKATDEAAEKRAAFGKTNDIVKAYQQARNHYDWMEPAMQRPDDLAMMDAEIESLEPLRKMRDMQTAAGRESADLRRYAAFVSVYAPVLGLDDAAAKAWALKPGTTEDEDFAEKVNAAVNRLGVEWLEDGIYYSDYADIMKLAPFIVDRLEDLGVNK